MKVLMVADARSIHTRRWAVSLRSKGVDIVLYSIFPSPDSFFGDHDIRLYVFDLFTYRKFSGIRSVAAMITSHSRAVRDLKSVIRAEAPDILHAHYATSFGLIAALSGFHPFIISVWGSDVYEFPEMSVINRESVKYIFRKADKILSTSHVMARHASRYTDKPMSITPFGVDTGLFRKANAVKRDPDCFVVGNVKTLAPKYGIDVLIRAYHLFIHRNPGLDSRLVIIGEGPCREEYVRLADELGIGSKVEFVGKIPNSDLPVWYNSFSVSVSLSDSESFGVVAVEAMACECPVVVSDADGFTEVVEDGVTGFIVPKRNPEAAAKAIQKFVDDPSLRETMGASGRERVKALYDWEDNVDGMINIYKSVSNV